MPEDDASEPIRTMSGVIDTEHYAQEARLARSRTLWVLMRGVVRAAARRRAGVPAATRAGLSHVEPTG